MRAEWLWAAALILALLVGLGVVPLPGGARSADSFNEDGAGKKAFFLLASELLADVKRHSDSLLPDDPDADTLVILGPHRYPDRAQWQSLHDWIAEGRSLVFAARWRDPAVALEPFGIEIVPTTEIDFFEETAVETDLVSGAVEWSTFGEIRHGAEAPDVEVLLRSDGRAQVVQKTVGNGILVVAASDHVFTNRSLTDDDRGLLAFRILEAAVPVGPVYFDESMNLAGAPRVVGILLEAPFRALTLQLVAVTLLFGWMASRRFGPIRRASRPARRSLVEHAHALGSLHFKVGTGGPLLQSYLELFRRELAPAGEVKRALKAAKSPSLARARLAAQLASLARSRARSRPLKGDLDDGTGSR